MNLGRLHGWHESVLSGGSLKSKQFCGRHKRKPSNEMYLFSHLFVYAVLLDGNLVDYGFCSKCETFIPKSVMIRADFNHKCRVERRGLYTGTKFTSPNLKSVPATNVGPKSHRIKGRNYECLLCGDGEKFTSIHCELIIA